MCISVTILCVFVDCFSLFIREGGSHSLFRNGTDFYGFYGFWPFSGVWNNYKATSKHKIDTGNTIYWPNRPHTAF